METECGEYIDWNLIFEHKVSMRITKKNSKKFNPCSKFKWISKKNLNIHLIANANKSFNSTLLALMSWLPMYSNNILLSYSVNLLALTQCVPQETNVWMISVHRVGEATMITRTVGILVCSVDTEWILRQNLAIWKQNAVRNTEDIIPEHIHYFHTL